MRIRLDAITSRHVDNVALAEGRTRGDAARVLIAEAVRARHGVARQAPDTEVEDSTVRGRTVAAHCKGQILAGVQRFAMLEDRSLSAALRILLRDALRTRGLLPSAATAPATAPTT
jgi:hypothetical protein